MKKGGQSSCIESNRPSTPFDSLIREYIFLGICLRCLGLKVNVYKQGCIKIFAILGDHHLRRRFFFFNIVFYLVFYH